jgi:limonene-1,2-epoxide hydrolase
MSHQEQLQNVILFFENITVQSVKDIQQLYSADAYFKDPFNEVHGVHAISEIFVHMYQQVDAPAFKIQHSILQDSEAFLVWDFSFRVKGADTTITIHGSSHISFNDSHQIVYHRDYWDVAEELYEKIPVLGGLMRFIKHRARQ